MSLDFGLIFPDDPDRQSGDFKIVVLSYILILITSPKRNALMDRYLMGISIE
jgi:hypothetical protein